MHRRTWLLIAFVFLALVGGAFGAANAVSPTDEQGFVNKINEERMARGLRPLIFDLKIRDVARTWTDHMATTNDFSHNPNYADQMPAGWSTAAENIAWGSGTSGTVESLHQAFMNSSGHRANILGDFTRVGVGVTVADGKMWVTEDFGKYAGDPIPNADGSVGSSGGTTTTTAPPSTTTTTAAPAQYTLKVSVKGKGTVTSTPAGINCAGDCNEAYNSGTTVTLTATARSGRTPSWGGACTGTATTCTVTMTAAKSAKVTFR